MKREDVKGGIVTRDGWNGGAERARGRVWWFGRPLLVMREILRDFWPKIKLFLNRWAATMWVTVKGFPEGRGGADSRCSAEQVWDTSERGPVPCG